MTTRTTESGLQQQFGLSRRTKRSSTFSCALDAVVAARSISLADSSFFLHAPANSAADAIAIQIVFLIENLQFMGCHVSVQRECRPPVRLDRDLRRSFAVHLRSSAARWTQDARFVNG